MLIETHAHLYLEQFQEDLEIVVERAEEAGVRYILLPAIDLASIEQAISLSERWDMMKVMAALHPSEVKDAEDADFHKIEEWAQDDRIIAIGETGLDYYWDRTFDEKQQDFLRRHIRLAAKVDKPLVFHDREASTDLIQIVREEKEASSTPDKIRGVFHCFGGPESVSKAVLDLGFHVGLGGTLTFKNGGVPDAVSSVPMDRIVLETDAPFLAPAPNRGKRNEPSWVKLVAEKLAEVRGLSIQEVEAVTTENALRVFGLSR
ncbi:MAG: TatD family hydrolase [Bacteroidetes Order II. Incertae sedis bacterium]|jgi:TatD DNase family protein|nr:TatD family hydrolase [Bacteroidetes Order II. bacterium]MDG1753706.1 TatD family hydrolase [Rhodothermales bacterium]MBT4051587.1 TatD family hydrolase [Bacteroidetes Order II. bacterium]MBT4603119.1 TatD family hydrolase [Bacteroidetes Order II. bacterium]MBT5249702.1 TatD family hydrolase [Bacteroidetes Order II. bacterium]